MPDQDRIKGAAKDIGGKLKQAAGKATGDTRLQTEGKIQNAFGKAKDALKGH